MTLIIRILANSGALWLASHYVPGFTFTGSTKELLIAGVILGLINGLVKPIVQLLAFPAIFLTLGLFNVIINIALLLFATRFIPHLHIAGIWPAFWGVVIISIVNHLISHVNKTGDYNKF